MLEVEKMINLKFRIVLFEYGNWRRIDGLYVDDFEVDVFVVGGGFVGVFCFWFFCNLGFKIVIYEVGNDLGGKLVNDYNVYLNCWLKLGIWRWNCYLGVMVDLEVFEY